MAKEELYHWLRLERPTDEDLEKKRFVAAQLLPLTAIQEEYFKQLTG
jgi:hypothetical protein